MDKQQISELIKSNKEATQRYEKLMMAIEQPPVRESAAESGAICEGHSAIASGVTLMNLTAMDAQVTQQPSTRLAVAEGAPRELSEHVPADDVLLSHLKKCANAVSHLASTIETTASQWQNARNYNSRPMLDAFEAMKDHVDRLRIGPPGWSARAEQLRGGRKPVRLPSHSYQSYTQQSSPMRNYESVSTRIGGPSRVHSGNHHFKDVKWGMTAGPAQSCAPTEGFARTPKRPVRKSAKVSYQRDESAHDDIGLEAVRIIADEIDTHIDEFTDDALFENFGIDSLMALTISARVKQELNLLFEADLFLQFPSVGTMTAHLRTVGTMKHEGHEENDGRRRNAGSANHAEGGLRDAGEDKPFADFGPIRVNKDGTVTTAGGDIVGRFTEGKLDMLAGQPVDAHGNICDKAGNVAGKAERWEPEEKERRINPMSGMRVDGEGLVRDENGDLLRRITQGNLNLCVNQEIDDHGRIIDAGDNQIGEMSLYENILAEEYGSPTVEEVEALKDVAGDEAGELLEEPVEEVEAAAEEEAKDVHDDHATSEYGREAKSEGPFAGFENLKVIEGGMVADSNGNILLRERSRHAGASEREIEKIVDDENDKAKKTTTTTTTTIERFRSPNPAVYAKVHRDYLSIDTLRYYDIPYDYDHDDPNYIIILREMDKYELDVVFEHTKQLRSGKLLVEAGKQKPEYAWYRKNERGRSVGKIVESNPKRLLGLGVDEDGDVLDKYRNVKGRADPLKYRGQEAIDSSVLTGKTLNKEGFVVDDDGNPLGRLVEGNAEELAGLRCDDNGQISIGSVVRGRCEHLQVPEVKGAEAKGLEEPLEGIKDQLPGIEALEGRELDQAGEMPDEEGHLPGQIEDMELNKKLAHGEIDPDTVRIDTIPECERLSTEGGDIFADIDGLSLSEDGTVKDGEGNIIGKIVEGNPKRLRGLIVDGDGDIVDKYGNVKGHAERLEDSEVDDVDEAERANEWRWGSPIPAASAAAALAQLQFGSQDSICADQTNDMKTNPFNVDDLGQCERIEDTGTVQRGRELGEHDVSGEERLLTLDGGGIRGSSSVALFKKLMRHWDEPGMDEVDLLVRQWTTLPDILHIGLPEYEEGDGCDEED